MFTKAFDEAVNHAMLYEVGGHWKLTPEVEAGLIETKSQKKAVGYVDDPFDNGGETKFGVAKNANTDLDITALTWSQAKEVYFRRYWLNGSCDKLPARIAVLHFDGCVNHGVGRANKFLQIALDVGVDGVIGPITAAKAHKLNDIDVCNKICDQREAFYKRIVANNPNQGRFLNGWLRRINEMRSFTADPSQSF
jgi:lysozyme family protein